MEMVSQLFSTASLSGFARTLEAPVEMLTLPVPHYYSTDQTPSVRHRQNGSHGGGGGGDAGGGGVFAGSTRDKQGCCCN